MGSVYKKRANPVRDFFIQMILIDINFKDKKIQDDIFTTIQNILLSVGVYEDELVYLDYKIKIDKLSVKIIPSNFICALWFIGALPDDPLLVIEHNQAIVGDYVYKFNKKTKKLSKRKINNE